MEGAGEDPYLGSLIATARVKGLQGNKLGLFDDPYKYCNPEREQKELNNPEHPKAAREIAAKSLSMETEVVNSPE